jgi:serine phosphatase RsbU (regulator of sigma subunit)/phage-related protein
MHFIGGLPIRAKVLLLAGIPVIGTLVLAVVIAQHARTQTAAAAALGSIEDVAQLSVHISSVMHALQLERARAALSEGYSGRQADTVNSSSEQQLLRQRASTDAAEPTLEEFLSRHDLSALPPRLARDLGIARAQANERKTLHARLAAGQVPIDQLLGLYDTGCRALLRATAALTELSDDGELLRSISSLVALAELSERASREHALLSYVFAAGEFPPGAFKSLVTLTTERDVYAETFRGTAHGDEARQFAAAEQTPMAVRARELHDLALAATSDEFDVDAQAWFRAAAGELAGLQAIEQALLGKITHVATLKLAVTRASMRFGWSLSIAVVLASGLMAWFIARGVTRSIFGLASAAARVRQTNDFSVRAAKTSNDELGTLTDTFNEMLTMIEQRDRHLEAQVAERTEELRRTLAELWTEMDLATKIQTVLLPQDPDLPSYRISAKMVPASSVGGDYYDVLRVDGVDWILIGDVSGHGVTSGLTMMLVQTAARTVLLSAGENAHKITPKQLLSRVNASVRSNIQKINADQYMTIMALRLEKNMVSFAGLHQDVLVYRQRSNTVERIETRGIWVGLVDDISDMLDDDTFEMGEGDTILLYTDGVTELTTDSKLLGTDGLATLLQQLAVGDALPDVIVDGVTERVRGGPVKDDVTVLAARYEPAKAAAWSDGTASVEQPTSRVA